MVTSTLAITSIGSSYLPLGPVVASPIAPVGLLIQAIQSIAELTGVIASVGLVEVPGRGKITR